MLPEKKPEDTYQDRIVRAPSRQMAPPDHFAEYRGQGSGIEYLLSCKQGYIVGQLGGNVLRTNMDGHLITIAPPRSGKSVSCIVPNLLDHPGSAFVIDIRGDTIARTATARWLMGQQVVVLDPYEVTMGMWGYDSFNPLDLLVPDTLTFESEVERVARAILFDPKGRSSTEPIWDNATILAITGALIYIKTCLPAEEQTLKSLYNFFTLDPEERQETAREIIDRAEHSGRYQEAILKFTQFLTVGSDKTKVPDNTVIQLMTLLGWVGHKRFDTMLSNSSFSFADMQTEPMTVYLVLPEEYIKGNESWVRMVFNAALSSLKEANALFGKSSRDLDQSQRVLFLIDEFPAFGQLQPVEDAVATIAARGATLWLFAQHISQLDKIYTEHGARQIIGSAALFQAFSSSEVHELDYISRVIGEEMFDVESVTVSSNAGTGGSESASQTVTIGNSESITLGKSRQTTKGLTRGVTDGISEGSSESMGTGTSHGTNQGVSDSEGLSGGTSTSHSTGINSSEGAGEGTNTSTNRGTSGDHYLIDYLIDIPLWKKKSHGQSWGKSYNRNWSQGFSDSISESENKGWSKNRSRSYSETDSASRNFTESNNRGKSHSESMSWSDSESQGTSESKTEGTSRSEGQSKSTGTNWTKGEGISYSVKPEQRKIETPRSLRMTISGSNQVLAIRGHYAFIAPRLVYFEKNAAGEYRFPDMAVLSGMTTLLEIWEEISPAPLPRVIPVFSCEDAPVEGMIQARTGEESQRIISGLFRKSATQRETALRFYDLAMRFAARFGARERLEQVENLAGRQDPSPGFFAEGSVLARWYRMDAERPKLTPAVPLDQAVETAWLQRHYRRADETRKETLAGVYRQLNNEIAEQNAAFGSGVPEFIARIEEAMEKAEMAASVRNAERRSNTNPGGYS